MGNLLLQRYRKHVKLSENSPVVSDAEGNGSTERDLPTFSATKQSMLSVYCDDVCPSDRPVIFQLENISHLAVTYLIIDCDVLSSNAIYSVACLLQ